MPQRLQQGRPCVACPHQFVEFGEVALLLLGHMADLVAGAAAPDHRELAVIDAYRAVFTGMVDADHRGDVALRRRIAGQGGRAFGDHSATAVCAPGFRPRRNTMVQIAAMISEASRFQPASDTPNSDHCTRSHMTGAVPRIWRFMSSSVIAPVELAVQAVGPANHFCSTPT